MNESVIPEGSKRRVAQHRTRVAAEGLRRVEVTVPREDASLVKAIAGVLRAGGKDATKLRNSLRPLVAASKAKTGPELVEFLRTAPIADKDLAIERETSTGRSAEFG